MGALANLQAQVDFTNPVSVNELERRHGLTLLCHRMLLILLILGSRWHYVCSLLVFATILCIHQMRIQSPLRCEFPGLRTATG
jgi:hypothetical protein